MRSDTDTKKRSIAGLGLALLVAFGLAAPAFPAQTVRYTYDSVGRLTTVTYNDSLTTTYTYDASGNITSIVTQVSVSAVGEPPGAARVPASFALGPSVPNPIRQAAAIRYEVPQPSRVKLAVYDIAGRHVQTLVDRLEPAGYHAALWNGRDSAGKPVPSGIYFYRLEAGAFKETRKLAKVE